MSNFETGTKIRKIDQLTDLKIEIPLFGNVMQP